MSDLQVEYIRRFPLTKIDTSSEEGRLAWYNACPAQRFCIDDGCYIMPLDIYHSKEHIDYLVSVIRGITK